MEANYLTVFVFISVGTCMETALQLLLFLYHCFIISHLEDSYYSPIFFPLFSLFSCQVINKSIFPIITIYLVVSNFDENFKKSHFLEISSGASKVMLKILQASLQQYVNREFPDVQAGFRKSRGTRDQIVNICWIMEKAREFQKNIYFCFIDYARAFDCVDHNKLWKILKEMGIPEHLTCLVIKLYAGQEATVRTGHGTTDWFQIGKGVCQGCILSPCSLNLYAEYIMRNAGLEETQGGV